MPGVLLFFEQMRALSILTMEQKGEIITSILDYSEYGVIPDFNDSMLKMAWQFILPMLDNDKNRYKQKTIDSAYAGYCRATKAKGLEPLNKEEWESERNQQAVADVSNSEQVKPKPKTDTVTITNPNTDTKATSKSFSEPISATTATNASTKANNEAIKNHSGVAPGNTEELRKRLSTCLDELAEGNSEEKKRLCKYASSSILQNLKGVDDVNLLSGEHLRKAYEKALIAYKTQFNKEFNPI